MPLTSAHSLLSPADITRTTLPNGIVVLARANFNSPSVFISGYLPAGALCEPDERLGLADFTAAALLRGTRQHDFQQIYDTLESAGASLGFDGGTHFTGFGGRALSEDLPLLLGLLAEALRYPVFTEAPVEQLRAQLLTGLAIRAQDTESMASLAFDQLAYPGHPYSRPDDGYPETVQAITRLDLAAFHAAHYGPRGLVLGIAGAVEPARAVELVGEALGDWIHPAQAGMPSLPPAPPLAGMLRRKVEIAGKSQADIILGAPGPSRRDAGFLAASLGNSVLGQFGMFGRIGKSLRERAGLAYYASSNLSGGPGPGAWYASAGVDPANVEQAVDLLQQEIARFVARPVSAEELSDSQAHYLGRLPLSLESNAGVVGAMLNMERYDLGLDYYQRYPALVQAVTPAQVLETARRFLHPQRLAVAVAGP